MSPRNPYLCLTIVGILGAGAILGMVGILVLDAMGRQTSEAAIAIVWGAFGSLANFLVSMPRGFVGGDSKQNRS